jgi:RNase H-fold protein (predicted Holliday junction resolvase)
VATLTIAHFSSRISRNSIMALLEGNVRRKERKQKVDSMAAQIILQSYHDAHNPSPAED